MCRNGEKGLVPINIRQLEGLFGLEVFGQVGVDIDYHFGVGMADAFGEFGDRGA